MISQSALKTSIFMLKPKNIKIHIINVEKQRKKAKKALNSEDNKQ